MCFVLEKPAYRSFYPPFTTVASLPTHTVNQQPMARSPHTSRVVFCHCQQACLTASGSGGDLPFLARTPCPVLHTMHLRWRCCIPPWCSVLLRGPPPPRLRQGPWCLRTLFFSISQQQSFADLLFDTIESLAPLHMYILGQCTGLFAFPCSCPLPPIPSPTGFDGRVLS